MTLPEPANAATIALLPYLRVADALGRCMGHSCPVVVTDSLDFGLSGTIHPAKRNRFDAICGVNAASANAVSPSRTLSHSSPDRIEARAHAVYPPLPFILKADARPQFRAIRHFRRSASTRSTSTDVSRRLRVVTLELLVHAWPRMSRHSKPPSSSSSEVRFRERRIGVDGTLVEAVMLVQAFTFSVCTTDELCCSKHPAPRLTSVRANLQRVSLKRRLIKASQLHRRNPLERCECSRCPLARSDLV